MQQITPLVIGRFDDIMGNSELTFEEIYVMSYDLLVRRCKREVGEDIAEDIVSETFIILYGKWSTLDSHCEKALTAWLCNAIKLKCLEYQRKASQRREVCDCDCENLLDRLPDTGTDANDEDQKYLGYINEIQGRLSPAELSVFNCIVVDRMNYKQTADMLNLSQVAVRVRWSRAKDHIKKFIAPIVGT